MNDQSSKHPNQQPQRDNAALYRGRYATHAAKPKPAPQEEQDSARTDAKDVKDTKNTAAAKPAPAPRPAARRSATSSAAAASAADSFARREKAREERSAQRSSQSARRVDRPRSNQTAHNTSTKNESSQVNIKNQRSNTASKDAKFAGENGSANPKANVKTSAKSANAKTASKPAGAKPANTKARNQKQEAEYTPYGFEPSARVGRLLRRIPFVLGAIGLAVIAFFAFGLISSLMPIEVTVNGTPVKLNDDRTVAEAFIKGGQPAPAGDLYDVEGELLEQGGGQRFAAAVNGKPVEDPQTPLEKGDAVVFSRGADKEEPLISSEETKIQPKAIQEGNGPLHVITQEGSQGLKVTKTGKISGKTVTQTVEKAQPRIYQSYFPNVGNDKVIALTFDDGPWNGFTQDILDILAANDAKATFFTIGERITPQTEVLVRRMANEGHQVCTHSWDHAAGSGQGVNLSYMSKAEQREEVQKGQQIITDVTGIEASTVFRAPGGNFPAKVWKNVEDLVSAEIGWDVDTLDWQKPGAEYIAEAIKSAGPGSVVLMHDGGGDRTQTVEALRVALPYLKEQGYRFITIDELLEYPPAK